jgi:maltooligosyltrehalose trehalohydrolase
MTHRFGPQITPDGVEFRLWAPKAEIIRLELDGQDAGVMARSEDGWHRLTRAAGPGSRYRFVLPDGLAVPDPASRFQPEGVHGPSEVIALPAPAKPAPPRPWAEAVVYELHVGTFTPEGTFRAAIERLPHLAALGVTTLEIMPVAAFPGRWNWGYDGVALFAPAAAYGRPEDLRALVEAAHAAGLSVMLDVVYNHFGPEGNYLPLYAPVFTERHRTPWGAAVNFDDDGSAMVRAFILENARYWIEAYGFDGLRLDAVHAIEDVSQEHILREIAATLRERPGARPVHLVVENEENDPALLDARSYDAQWNDDVHHVLHVAVTGEHEGYYADYAGRPDLLARALAEGFAFQGETMAYRGSPRGGASAALPPSHFVAFLQNHDQIGNRALGDRIHHGHPAAAVRAAAAAYLLSPQVPMLFQGEEWAGSTPFQFFCDLGDDLKEAVREGRRAEFARFSAFADPAARARIPDPTAEATFRASKLDWQEIEKPDHAAMLDWYRRVLAVRREVIAPLVGSIVRGGEWRVMPGGVVAVTWQAGDDRLSLRLSLSAEPAPLAEAPVGRVVWSEGPGLSGGQLGPWSCLWTLVRAADGGD